MADEQENEILEESQEEVLEESEDTSNKRVDRSEKRYQELSKKVSTTAQERDQAQKERDEAKKEAEFYSSFSDAIDKFPAAKEYKDQIKEKVLAGYSIEDAAVAILAKEGKFTPPPEQVESPAGGSATTPPASGETKSLEEMSLEEKRAELIKAVDRGDISV